jgi:hypothetical protein
MVGVVFGCILDNRNITLQYSITSRYDRLLLCKTGCVYLGPVITFDLFYFPE